MAWALVNGIWQYTNQPTPGSVNMANYIEPNNNEVLINNFEPTTAYGYNCFSDDGISWTTDGGYWARCFYVYGAFPSNVIKVEEISNINTNDLVNITTSISSEYETVYYISVSDDINLNENYSYYIESLFIDIYDVLNISETEILSNIISGIYIYDLININENIYIQINNISISTSDALNINEDISALTTISNISALDLINISENILINVGIINISVYDYSNIYENSTLNNINLGEINIYDSLIITDLPDPRKEFTIFVNDQINTYENLVFMFPFYLLWLSDNISINENVVIYFSLGDINIHDLVITTEEISTERISNINIHDSLYLLGEVQNTIKLDSSINEYDYIDIVETITINIDILSIYTYDSVDILENLTEVRNLTIYIYDSINITDNLSGDSNLNLIVNDLILINENNEAEWLLSINSYENVIISESTSFESFRISKSIKRPIGRSYSIGRPIGSTNSI
jgi:hypothetical protein